MNEMNALSPSARILAIFLTVLALADGILHLSLDFVLFRGNLFGPLGPPPGAAPPAGAAPPPPQHLPVPLNQLFVLNFVGYLLLVLFFWFVAPRLSSLSWLGAALLIIWAAATFFGWVMYGAPNPRGLAYLSKGVEIVLVIALLAYLFRVQLVARRRTSGAASAS